MSVRIYFLASPPDDKNFVYLVTDYLIYYILNLVKTNTKLTLTIIGIIMAAYLFITPIVAGNRKKMAVELDCRVGHQPKGYYLLCGHDLRRYDGLEVAACFLIKGMRGSKIESPLSSTRLYFQAGKNKNKSYVDAH
jgi:hypothetical protein